MLARTGVTRELQPARICQLCVDVLDITGAGISVVTGAGNRGVVCATDDVSAQIEDLQFTLGEGPCIDAVQAGAPVLIRDLDDPGNVMVERWPAFMEGAAAAGVRAVFAFPLRIGAINVGAMDLYRSRPGALGIDQLPAALMAADAAAVALIELASTRTDAFGDNAATRSSFKMEVHQATGMVGVQAGVTMEEAFLLLRARAFAAGRPLAEIAMDVVERRLRFPLED
jgi:hypothetical protein